MACNPMFQKVQKVQLVLFRPSCFDFVIDDGGWSEINLIIIFSEQRTAIYWLEAWHTY